MPNVNGLTNVFSIFPSLDMQEGGVGKSGGSKKTQKIQYTVLTAAQNTHRRSRKTSSSDAMVKFQCFLTNKPNRAGHFLRNWNYLADQGNPVFYGNERFIIQSGSNKSYPSQ
jgi:hypothetical protein